MENIQIDDLIYKEKIMKEIHEKNESLMAKEIEEYIEESMKKMYAEMDEIKLSYEDSINEAIGKLKIFMILYLFVEAEIYLKFKKFFVFFFAFFIIEFNLFRE